MRAKAYCSHLSRRDHWALRDISRCPDQREKTLVVVRDLPPLFPFTNHTRGLAARRLFRVPPCCKGTIHLQTSISSPGFEPRAYGIAVSVANHCSGGVGTSGSERCPLHEDQAQDALERPVVKKTATSLEMHAYTQLLHLPPSSHSDESRFNLSYDDNRVRVWRPHNERLNPAFALQQHTAPTAGVMTAQRYVHDILQPHVFPLLQRLPRATFQQDNAQPYTARVSQDSLRTVTIPWPDRSPDLSLIEQIWDHLGRRVGHPTSLKELEARLQEIWNEMSQDIIQIFYASMPDRIASCIRARGGSTRY
ncbi:transposable element Tcb2 transposase [Trichonephila clavipes]|nr:transposable element Tcb2 transposase [Trichonephila clavipes]